MAKELIDLNGSWQFKEYPLSARRMRDLEQGGWLDTKVPNSIFTSLIEAGQINRQEVDASPEKFAWISEKSWVFSKNFEVSADFFDCDKADLVFKGLDTIASIWLNEKLIARTDNMFIEHRFDVKQYLKTGKNHLLVKFDPALEYAKNLMLRYGNINEADFSNPCRSFIRKSQYQFGWDWCPAMPGCGIWRKVRLEGIDKASIKNVHIRTINCDENIADIRVAAELTAVIEDNLTLLVSIKDTDGNIIYKANVEPHAALTSIVISIEKPHLWFPAGYGRQNLYEAEITLFSKEQPLDTKQVAFGIRTIQLDRSPDSFGEKFQFVINNIPVCAKGGGWIPATIFPGSLSEADYEKLLSAAKDANINMLRIWGGGYYEDDIFYKTCDRFGIMVWQDFMFACAYYPDREWFIEKVKAEAHSIAARLRNHPCIVLWCGNNEIDWMHYKSLLGKGKKFYGKTIYHKLLPHLLAELDPDRPYIPTTPHSSTKDPNTPENGTMHNWRAWSGNEPASHYIQTDALIPRFVAEFGFQGMPEKKTIEQFCPARHLRTGSFSLEKHNYQINGNSRIYRYLGDLFGAAGDIESFIYLSQLTQARAVKSYVEFLRANRNVNSGAIFWQFNDCCPAISWSAVDYLKRPKALYYYAKRFFAPVMITAVGQFDKFNTNAASWLKSLSAVAVNDTPEAFIAKVSCSLISLDGTLIDQVQLPVSVGAFSSSQPIKIPQNIVFCPNPDKSILHLQIERDGVIIAENIHLFLPDKYINWQDVNISAKFSKTADACGTITLTSDKPAKDVKVEIKDIDVKLSDNYIDLLANNTKILTAKFNEPLGESVPLIKLTSVPLALAMQRR